MLHQQHLGGRGGVALCLAVGQRKGACANSASATAGDFMPLSAVSMAFLLCYTSSVGEVSPVPTCGAALVHVGLMPVRLLVTVYCFCSFTMQPLSMQRTYLL